jgi:hypothetical protein
MGNKLQLDTLQHKVLKMIPLRIIWTAGVPSIQWNPENEAIALTDNGAGDVTLTFASGGLVPLKLLGMGIEVADANVAGLVGNIDGAASATVMKLVFNAAGDGTTETDPVAVDLLIGKFVVA